MHDGPQTMLDDRPASPPPPAATRTPTRRPLPTVSSRLQAANVLIIGINYAPEPTGIAPYTTGIADHLATVVARVDVLTGIPHHPSWRVPREYRWALRIRAATGPSSPAWPNVTRVRHYVPSRPNTLTRAAYEVTFLSQALSTRIHPAPDLVLAVTPSLSGAVAAARIAERLHVPLVIIVQDLLAATAGGVGPGGDSRVAASSRRLERYALTHADQIAVVNEAFRGPVRDYGIDEDRIHLVPNWTHIPAPTRSAEQARAALGLPRDAFVVAHTGTMGLKQDLGTVIEAARLLAPRPDIRFLLVGDGSQRQTLVAQAAGLPNVTFMDTLPADRYPLALAASDVLLVSERACTRGLGVPKKLTSYLAAGRPVIAAVAMGGATAAELDRTRGAGTRVDPGDPLALATAVMTLQPAVRTRAAMGAAALTYARAHLDRSTSMDRLQRVLEQALPPS